MAGAAARSAAFGQCRQDKRAARAMRAARFVALAAFFPIRMSLGKPVVSYQSPQFDGFVLP